MVREHVEYLIYAMLASYAHLWTVMQTSFASIEGLQTMVNKPDLSHFLLVLLLCIKFCGTVIHICLCIICVYCCSTRAGLRNLNRDCAPCKTNRIYCLRLTGKVCWSLVFSKRMLLFSYTSAIFLQMIRNHLEDVFPSYLH